MKQMHYDDTVNEVSQLSIVNMERPVALMVSVSVIIDVIDIVIAQVLVWTRFGKSRMPFERGGK